MNDIQDWCISRQIWWGHRIPVFYYDKDQYVVAKDQEEALRLAQGKTAKLSINLSDLLRFSLLFKPITIGFPEVRHREII